MSPRCSSVPIFIIFRNTENSRSHPGRVDRSRHRLDKATPRRWLGLELRLLRGCPHRFGGEDLVWSDAHSIFSFGKPDSVSRRRVSCQSISQPGATPKPDSGGMAAHDEQYLSCSGEIRPASPHERSGEVTAARISAPGHLEFSSCKTVVSGAFVNSRIRVATEHSFFNYRSFVLFYTGQKKQNAINRNGSIGLGLRPGATLPSVRVCL